MKKYLTIIMFMFAITIKLQAGNVIIPNDATTLEALIDLHKTMATYEEDSKKQEVKSSGANVWHTQVAKKWHDVRDTINSKLDIANQWVGIAAAASRTSLDILDLIKDYTEFTKFATKEVGHKPFVSWYYIDANYNIYKRLKFVKKSLATVVSSETNILKASMADHSKMIWNVDREVSELRKIINNAMFWMRCYVYDYVKIDYIWEILNSNVVDGIAENVVDQWYKNLRTF